MKYQCEDIRYSGSEIVMFGILKLAQDYGPVTIRVRTGDKADVDKRYHTYIYINDDWDENVIYSIREELEEAIRNDEKSEGGEPTVNVDISLFTDDEILYGCVRYEIHFRGYIIMDRDTIHTYVWEIYQGYETRKST